MATVQGVVDGTMQVQTEEEKAVNKAKAEEGLKSVKSALSAHRDRLTFRQRMEIQSRITPNKLQLRPTKKVTGAEWIGFNLNDTGNTSDIHLRHKRKKADEDARSGVQKAYDLADLDGDHVITMDEAIAYIFSMPVEERPKQLQDANPFNRTWMKKVLKKYDTEGIPNGVLTFNEFETFWEANDK